jgi:sulfoxide reductase heme-binding subunit YedZ
MAMPKKLHICIKAWIYGVGINMAAALKLSAWPWQLVLIVLGLLPAIWLIIALFANALGANPIERLLDETGIWTLRFLALTLLIQPLQKTWRISNPQAPLLLPWRRTLGLLAFFYALSHAFVYVFLDRAAYWPEIVEDVTTRPYIMIGMVAVLLLLPLAITSTRFAMRLLKKNWQRLHRLTYLIAALALLHFFMAVKLDWLEPALYLGIFLLLALWRFWLWRLLKKSREIIE